MEKTKPVLLERYRAVRAEQLRMATRERELEAVRQREAEAKALAERAVRNQEEARKQRLLEMQKLDLAKAYEKRATTATATATLDDQATAAPSIPALTPSPAPPPPKPVTSLAKTPPAVDQLVVQPTTMGTTSAECTCGATCVRAADLMSSRIDFSENGMALRLVRIPQSIVSQFLSLATENTRKNLETCGVLAGKLAHDQFTITTLIMPKQTSTSDTVAMLNEEEIFEVQDRRELLTLGWIHTHPTQQCFMSSVDLHTHFPYQLLIAEAIAIVVAPTQSPNYGIFRLTDPPGIGIIAKCPKRGFHHHPSPEQQQQPIYRELSGPRGHAKMMENLSLEVVELRY